ncbi:beta-D-glucosyl crocetin beta-1,6-glucosyltransferase-like [Cucurbita moschata]|uniref:Glycosyltransferase n=1 Tax=Cucurbita moschata TaxID=3662 RepID=A0A6J1FSQ9_CUCMO|nr:beta-D-glucosyl crocetin beta-1,6-glucosyltransferase-like [Cucurbita moschata]
MDAQKAVDTPPTTVLMLPWIGYGHLSAYLELAKALSRRNFHVYFCSTPVNLDSIKPNLIPPPPSIQFVDLHLPSSPELPPHLHTTNGLPSHLKPTLHQAFSAAAQHFEAILQTLSPHLLIYDSLQPWAPRIASSLNIPAINFNTTAVSIIAHALHSVHYPDSKFPFSDFVLHDYWKAKYTTADGATSEKTRRGVEAFLYCLNASCDVVLVNSFRELEGEYMDYLSVLLKKKVVSVGPLVYEPSEGEEDEEYWRIKKWLDEKEALSTVLVSFGSEYFPPKEEMEEIAHGLEESEANFIWVVRFPKGEESSSRGIEEALPKGFVERAGERAMVVKKWAPQGKILKHGSIGGFVSHCGWNSVLESIRFGVPVIGAPMHLDQPYNAGLLEEAGIGVEAKRDADGKIQRDQVASLIKQVVVEKTREDIWKKVREMREVLRRRDDDDMMIDEMVAVISVVLKI